MDQKSILSHRLSVWLSWILGVLAIFTGIAIIIAAFTALEPVTSGMKSIAEGLRSANSAVELIGKDFGSSSSLFGEVSNSIRGTREVVRETRITVDGIRQSTQEIRALVLSVSSALDNLPPTIMSMIGRSYFSETIANLNNTYYT
ncbi:MAG: hypothetical protein GF388_10545, partial [Candidatus Aegiribacteria sp.]|nr:hypothetical protein [Candidatus Aegiribacteria sp.]MBD3295460.1 hypothetical protein [Candidatus Fermentibacteria bacterium]